jgi:hypothetical protein
MNLGEEKSIYNISSANQSGGITAGIVNIFNKYKIELTEENKNQILSRIADRNTKIWVSLQEGGGSELTQFAEDIKHFLINEGYQNVIGVNRIFGFSPFKGVIIEQKSNTGLVIFVGSL